MDISPFKHTVGNFMNLVRGKTPDEYYNAIITSGEKFSRGGRNKL